MSFGELSFFDEKSGVVFSCTPWGRWWQTVQEVHVEVNLPQGTSAKEVAVNVSANDIECVVKKRILFKGRLFGTVHPDETVWTVEDQCTLTIVLAKADSSLQDDVWAGLLEGDEHQADLPTLHEMRKKLDLERFQMEHPGLDFSSAKLSKTYDRLPGWSRETSTQQPGQDNSEEQDTRPDTSDRC